MPRYHGVRRRRWHHRRQGAGQILDQSTYDEPLDDLQLADALPQGASTPQPQVPNLSIERSFPPIELRRLVADVERPMKPFSPHCERNQAPILEVLRPHFVSCRRVLEIGSGTGQHALYFARALPSTVWQTSDVQEALPGLRMWLAEAALANLPPPLQLDVNGDWPQTRFDAAFTANTLHIMGWSEVEQLFAGLDRVLEARAMLAVYGPFNYGGRFTSASNRAFNEWLKRQSAVSGVRDFEAVDALARAIGFELIDDHAMPANNRLLIWARTA